MNDVYWEKNNSFVDFHRSSGRQSEYWRESIFPIRFLTFCAIYHSRMKSNNESYWYNNHNVDNISYCYYFINWKKRPNFHVYWYRNYTQSHFTFPECDVALMTSSHCVIFMLKFNFFSTEFVQNMQHKIRPQHNE